MSGKKAMQGLFRRSRQQMNFAPPTHGNNHSNHIDHDDPSWANYSPDS